MGASVASEDSSGASVASEEGSVGASVTSVASVWITASVDSVMLSVGWGTTLELSHPVNPKTDALRISVSASSDPEGHCCHCQR